MHPDLVLPPSLWAPTSSEFIVSFDGQRYDPQVKRPLSLAERFPAPWWNPLITWVNRFDTPRIYRGIIAVGTVAALLVGLAALVVATVDRALERRRPLAHLLAVGASPRTIRSAYAAQLLPATMIMLSLAGTAAIIGGSAYLRWADPSARLPARRTRPIDRCRLHRILACDRRRNGHHRRADARRGPPPGIATTLRRGAAADHRQLPVVPNAAPGSARSAPWIAGRSPWLEPSMAHLTTRTSAYRVGAMG